MPLDDNSEYLKIDIIFFSKWLNNYSILYRFKIHKENI